jgi:hypothetical protein
MTVVRRLEQEVDMTLEDLDKKLGRVLAKQEYDYVRCYTLFVKRKERELRELIAQLSEKARDDGRLKDQKVKRME